MLVFTVGLRATPDPRKDTLRNIITAREFVVNIVSEEIGEKMNLCAGEYPPEVDEFEVSGLTPIPSDLVKAPRVAESHINMECRLLYTLSMSALPTGGNLVLGEVVRFHIDDAYISNYRIDPDKLRAIGRMARQQLHPHAGSLRHDPPGLTSRTRSSTGEQSVENFARPRFWISPTPLSAPAHSGAFRRPAAYQLGEHVEMTLGIRQTGFGMAGIDAQGVIHGPVERRRIQQEFRIGALQVPGGFNDIDPLRRVQHLVENSPGSQAQIQQREIDIVESAVPGFQRVLRTLFFLLQAQAASGAGLSWSGRFDHSGANPPVAVH